MSPESTLDFTATIDTIAESLRGDGWLVLPEFLPLPWCEVLLADCLARRAEFASAAIGRGNQRQHVSEQRRDATLWLSEAAPVQRDYLAAMDELRAEINRRLFLGLRDYEAHYAHYAPGAFYRRHRDAFAQTQANAVASGSHGAPQRILTTVAYLNASVGGELVIYRDEHEIARVTPAAGTAVFFLSAEFPHEVLPAQSDRYSISGWFRN
ncbi:MAG: 2OG-Fe(II) oxygenase [Spongiibacteraceae bacterium]